MRSSTLAASASASASALVLALALALAVAVTGCGRDAPRRGLPAATAAELLIDRNWIDAWPHDKDDRLRVYRFVPSMGGGVYQDRTVFKGAFELFQYTTDGAHLDYHFPHDGLRKRARFTIERIDGPPPFDLRLTIHGDPRGPGTYFGWTEDRGLELDALLARRR
ncbi:MAG: hypothetical protein HS111_27155 [Kofleriaceae bacterium]|nr:hypothetical protein [Kofleriaceae bacterium]MCL4226343.1 hypothetical protein [Myxococcales bacterium]